MLESKQAGIEFPKKIPCEECPVFPICFNKESINCKIVTEYLHQLQSTMTYDDFQRESQPVCDLFHIYGFMFDNKIGNFDKTGRRTHDEDPM